MTGLAPIAPKVTKLILMLGSSHDGEALNAARALARTLASNGLSFHDLADVIDRQPERNIPPPSPPRYDPPGDAPQTVAEVARFCLDSGGRLTARERDFLVSMLTWRKELTLREQDYLGDLFERCGGVPW